MGIRCTAQRMYQSMSADNGGTKKKNRTRKCHKISVFYVSIIAKISGRKVEGLHIDQ